MIKILFSFLFFCAIGFSVVVIYMWIIHILASIKSDDSSGFANYSKFKRHIKNVNVENIEFNYSRYSCMGEMSFRHDILKFNGKIMIMTDPNSYLMMRIDIAKFIGKNHPRYKNKEKVKW